MPKLKNSNATFSVIFKQYVTYYRKVVCINDEKYLRKDELFGMWLRTTSLVLRGRGPKSSLSWKQERCIQAPSLNPHCDDHFFRSHLHKKWMIWLHKDPSSHALKLQKLALERWSWWSSWKCAECVSSIDRNSRAIRKDGSAETIILNECLVH